MATALPMVMNIKPKADAGATRDARPLPSGFDGRDLVVIIVNYRTPEHVARCLDSLAAERLRTPGFSVVVVDGGSADGSADRLARLIADSDIRHWVRLIALGVNGGFGYANNQAMLTLAAEGRRPEAILLLNPDTIVRPGALAALLGRLASDSRIGAVGARLEHEDGRPQGGVFRFPSLRDEFCRGARTAVIDRLMRRPPIVIDTDVACAVPWVTGAAVLLRRDALAETGLFDDGFFLYFEETELMQRLSRKGWACWHEPTARVVHYYGQATGLRDPVTGAHRAARLPAYWYRSRRRYWVRVHGSAVAVIAGLSWLAGRALWRTRCLLTRRIDDTPPRGGRDLLRLGLWPSRADRGAGGPVAIDERPGALPAWVEK